MSKYFYHGIRSEIVAPDTMIDVFKSGGIKSKRKLSRSYRCGFNGADYISICRKGTDEEYARGYNNAFYTYILNRFCFIIRDDINAIQGEFTPEVVEWDRFQLVRFMVQHPERRITDLFDEWQVRDEINLKDIIGIGIPWDWVETIQGRKREQLDEMLEQIVAIATTLGLDIVDSSQSDFVERYEKHKEATKNVEFKLNV